MSDSVGISSACFYPLETEKSLARAGELSIKTVELFLNSTSEISEEYTQRILSIKKENNLDIVSVHSLQSFAESYWLFSNYERRFYDSLPLYRQIFTCAHKLGAEIVVFHGLKKPGSISDGEYCRRFAAVIALGEECGVQVCHENVVRHKSESPEYLKMMRDKIGDKFKVVFDIKQAHRAGYTHDDFLKAVGRDIVHVHVSDCDCARDCLAPFMGKFDFADLFSKLNALDYKGKYIIELYKWSYENTDEIVNAYEKLNKLYLSIKNGG